jgi:hypothetical protein
MDSTIIEKLFQDSPSVTLGDAVHLVSMARTDPNIARMLWQSLLSSNLTDERLGMAFHWLLESVVIDQIANRISDDDEFAVVIGRRISSLIEQMAQVPSSQAIKAA